MGFSKYIAAQLGHPSGIVGHTFIIPLLNKRNAALNDVAVDHLFLKPDDRVLEVGFGGGYLLQRITAIAAGGFVAGIDISSDAAAYCEKHLHSRIVAGRLELKVGSAEALPYPDGHFTRVCAVNSIFYWQDASKAISEFWRVLDHTGLLVLVFTTPEHLQEKNFSRHGLNLRSGEEVRIMVESAGFSDVQLVKSSDRYREFICLTCRKMVVKEVSKPEPQSLPSSSPVEEIPKPEQPLLGQQNLF